MDKQDLVQLEIKQDLIKPIVEKQIKAAVVEALGGTDELIEKIVSNIVNQKVNSDGKVSTYSGDNKYTWIEWAMTSSIRDAIKEEALKQIQTKQRPIKNAIVKALRSEKYSSQLADAMIMAFADTVDKNWKSQIEIKLEKPSTW